MRNARKLSLKRESLADLSTDELGTFAGANALTHATCGLCLTQVWSYANCPTTPVNECTAILDMPRTLNLDICSR